MAAHDVTVTFDRVAIPVGSTVVEELCWRRIAR